MLTKGYVKKKNCFLLQIATRVGTTALAIVVRRKFTYHIENAHSHLSPYILYILHVNNTIVVVYKINIIIAVGKGSR